MKVNVQNPTDQDIKVTIEGHEYFVEAKGEVEVPEAHAAYWKGKLHQFMILKEIKTEEKKEVKKETADKVEAVVAKAVKKAK